MATNDKKSTGKATKAINTPKTTKPKGGQVDHIVDSKQFVGEEGLRVNIRLQTFNGKFTANAVFVAKGEKPQVGCRSWHETVEEGRVAYEKIIAQAAQLGWHDPLPKGVKTPKTPKANTGKFDISSFPAPIKIKTAMISKDEAAEMLKGDAPAADVAL